MRADLEYITGVLDELETIFQDASKVPMNRTRATVDRSDVLVLVRELRDSLPKELEEARSIHREHESIIAAGHEEAGRIVENARNRSQEMIQDSETYQRAQRRAEENVDMAEKYSEEVSRGSEAYREQVMAQLERWFGESLESVAESRQELEVAPRDSYDSGDAADSGEAGNSRDHSQNHSHLDETQPQERQERQERQEQQEPVAGDGKDSGEWRGVSSA